jgi:hypothetical protein
MPQILTLLLDLGPGEKGMTEKRALLSKRKMTLCFPTVRTTWGSSVWMSRLGAWTGDPQNHHSREPYGLFSEWRWGPFVGGTRCHEMSQNTLKNKRLEPWSYRQERNFIDRERLSRETHRRVWKPGAPPSAGVGIYMYMT